MRKAKLIGHEPEPCLLEGLTRHGLAEGFARIDMARYEPPVTIHIARVLAQEHEQLTCALKHEVGFDEELIARFRQGGRLRGRRPLLRLADQYRELSGRSRDEAEMCAWIRAFFRAARCI